MTMNPLGARHVSRTFAMVTFVAVLASANADLKMTVVVNTSAESTRGIPKSGSYEVDFKGSLARILEPSGAVRLFDFGASQIAVLDSTTKTYYVDSISNLGGGPPRSQTSASVYLDHSTASQVMFGASAQKVLISSQSNGGGQSGAFNGGSGGITPLRRGASNGGATQVAQGNGPSSSTNQSGTGRGGSSSMNFTGSAWIASGSSVKASISSVSPLVLIGAPRTLVASIATVLDQEGVIPVSFSFSWNDASNRSYSLAMTVNAVDASTLEATLFNIPSDYTQVKKPQSK